MIVACSAKLVLYGTQLAISHVVLELDRGSQRNPRVESKDIITSTLLLLPNTQLLLLVFIVVVIIIFKTALQLMES